MKLLKLFSSFSLMAFSLTTVAATAVAPANRIRIWEGSALSFPDSQYSIGTTTAMGTIKTLKSNPTVINLLTNLNIASNTGGLDMSQSKLETVTAFNNGQHQRLNENGGAVGQCVAFAKAMTGAPSTPNWYKGKSLMDYLSWNGIGYYLNNNNLNIPQRIQPGTMIAHFQGLTKYPQRTPYGHVAIFLSWSYNSQGYIDGVNVVDQNLISYVSGNTGSAVGLIQKHKLPLICNGGSSCGNSTYHTTFFSGNYHIVDVR